MTAVCGTSRRHAYGLSPALQPEAYLRLSKLASLSLAPTPLSWCRLDGSNSHTGTGGVLVSLLRVAFSIRCSDGPRLELPKPPHAGCRVARPWHRPAPHLHSTASRSDNGAAYSGGDGVPVIPHRRRADDMQSSRPRRRRGVRDQWMDGAAPSHWGLGSVRPRRRGRCVSGARRALDWAAAASMEAPRSDLSSGGGEANGRTGARGFARSRFAG
jgi:hypothetical protein